MLQHKHFIPRKWYNGSACQLSIKSHRRIVFRHFFKIIKNCFNAVRKIILTIEGILGYFVLLPPESIHSLKTDFWRECRLGDVNADRKVQSQCLSALNLIRAATGSQWRQKRRCNVDSPGFNKVQMCHSDLDHLHSRSSYCTLEFFKCPCCDCVFSVLCILWQRSGACCHTNYLTCCLNGLLSRECEIVNAVWPLVKKRYCIKCHTYFIVSKYIVLRQKYRIQVKPA